MNVCLIVSQDKAEFSTYFLHFWREGRFLQNTELTLYLTSILPLLRKPRLPLLKEFPPLSILGNPRFNFGMYLHWSYFGLLNVIYIYFHLHFVTVCSSLSYDILSSGGSGRPKGCCLSKSKFESKFLHFHTVFGKIWSKRSLVPPLQGFTPSSGKSWIPTVLH